MELSLWLVRRRMWEDRRKQGWFRFVVLRRAIPLSIAGTLGTGIASHLFHHDLRLALANAAWLLLVGIAFGAAIWLLNEYRFHRTTPYPQDPET